MCERYYTVHEELFVLLFNPVIYRIDDLFIGATFFQGYSIRRHRVSDISVLFLSNVFIAVLWLYDAVDRAVIMSAQWSS